MARLPGWMTGISAKLAAATTLAVVTAFLLLGYLFAAYHRGAPLARAERAARAQADLIAMALEHEMLSNDRDRLRLAMEGFRGEDAVEGVALLDAQGVVRFSSVRSQVGVRFERGSQTCAVCHDRPVEARPRSAVFLVDGVDVLRTVKPIWNRAECRSCHSPSLRIVGMLVVDQPAAVLGSDVAREVRWFAVVTAVVALALLGTVALIVRVVVLRRLRELGDAAGAIAAGDLDRRIAVRGDDELTTLGRRFNAMAAGIQERMAEVQRLHAYFETVLDRLAIGVSVVDEKGIVEYANWVVRSEFGDVRGRPCREALAAERPCDRCPGAEASRGGAVVVMTHTTPRGRVVGLTCCSLIGPDGAGRIVETAVDLTRNEQIRQRLLRAERLALAGEIAAGVVHTINNPLDGMRRAVDLMESRPGDEQRRIEMLGVLREGIDRVAGVTSTLLSFARADLDPSRDPVSVNRVVEEAVHLMRLRADTQSVSLGTRLGEALPAIEVGAQGLHQVVVNLLLNAFDALSGPGSVEVRTGVAPDGLVEIDVEDDGCGIAPEDLGKVFEPFFTTKPAGRGTGLGLSVARRIVEGRGGEILVKSTPGEGSVFTVRLPVREDSPARPPEGGAGKEAR